MTSQNWETSICKTDIAKYNKKFMQSDNKIWSANRIQNEKHLIEFNMRNMFFKKNNKHIVVEKLFPDTFLKNQI